MNTSRATLALFVLGAASASGLGCWKGDDVESFSGPIVRREGSVVVEGCTLDEAQSGALASAGAKQVLHTVILLCGGIQDDGTIAATAPADATTVTAQISALHALGYRVSIAFTIGADGLTQTSGDQAFADLQSPTWSPTAIPAMLAFANGADGIELALPTLPDVAATAVIQFVHPLVVAAHPSMQVGIFAPPTSQTPSDISGGDAYDIPALGALVDHLRLMTLDYSCCGAGPGPTIDPGWAVQVERFEASYRSNAPFDVAYPLYGSDFDSSGNATFLSFAAATQLAGKQGVQIARGPTGAPNFSYYADDGDPHQVWFDDAISTTRALHAWDASTLPTNVGVLYYGLGEEDPSLWQAIADQEGR